MEKLHSKHEGKAYTSSKLLVGAVHGNQDSLKLVDKDSFWEAVSSSLVSLGVVEGGGRVLRVDQHIWQLILAAAKGDICTCPPI